jgi:hypothetical protein
MNRQQSVLELIPAHPGLNLMGKLVQTAPARGDG